MSQAELWCIIFQLLGVFFVLIAGLNKKKKVILVLSFCANICSTLVMILAGRYDGAVATVICTVRSFLFLYQDRVKNNSIFWISVAAHFIAGVLSWQSPLSALIIFAPIVLCYVNWFGKAKDIKYGTIVSCLCWTVFDIINGVYIEAGRDVAEIISNIIGIYRLSGEQKPADMMAEEAAE